MRVTSGKSRVRESRLPGSVRAEPNGRATRPVCNLAARLCSEAKDGQILISSRVAGAVEDSGTLEQVGDVSLKGLSQAVVVYNVV